MIWFVLFIIIFAFGWALISDGPWLSGKKKEKMNNSSINKLVMIIGFILAVFFIFATISDI